MVSADRLDRLALHRFASCPPHPPKEPAISHQQSVAYLEIDLTLTLRQSVVSRRQGGRDPGLAHKGESSSLGKDKARNDVLHVCDVVFYRK
jgi:hypothetical protein